MLYPFAKEQLQALIASYPNLKEIAWVQEEPRNMGAWKVMSRRMPELLPEGVELDYIGRQGRASPGEGYSGAHAREQERIVLTALTPRYLTPMARPLREARPRAPCSSGSSGSPGSSWRSSPACSLFWLAPGFETETMLFGWAHGLGFIALCIVIWIAAVRREAPYTLLAATLTPVGPVGSVIGIELIERKGWGIAEPGSEDPNRA